ncbi:glycosyltransferase [Desulfosporosinus sp.]|uniref:CgeB family protein n=1 Tax=Desulfosporosinus sp. TaxID=157907 RepID=UPI0025C630C3|nr:glycosyltransferase [Desulfosporosinus sp.]MBC2723286.1 glycosyltransferase [Desulfosporosinus sp.]MBC2728581.1 glycosyltransferase [Desulfosporosinus sp.]
MNVLFLNDSSLLCQGLASGFSPLDDIRYIPVHLSGWEDRLSSLLRTWKPTFALAEGVSISTVAQKLFPLLRRYRLPLVYWAIDDPPDWLRMSRPLARGASLVLTPAQECLPLYKRERIRAHYFHFACNPSFHRPLTPSPEFTCDLLLVANYYTSYPQRRVGLETLLTPLLSKQFDLKVFGNEHWLSNTDGYILEPNVYQGYLPYDRLPNAYSSAKIVLGLHSVIDSPTMMSMRTFEALGCGAFFLTHWTPALENFFKNHVHLVWSRHPDETLELVRFYLSREDLRQKIARQGREEVYRNHTYQHRIQSVLKYLQGL